MFATTTILKNGPIKIEGDFRLNDASSASFNLAADKAVFLCRCGHSSNKPFCDGSHGKQGFESEVKAA